MPLRLQAHEGAGDVPLYRSMAAGRRLKIQRAGACIVIPNRGLSFWEPGLASYFGTLATSSC